MQIVYGIFNPPETLIGYKTEEVLNILRHLDESTWPVGLGRPMWNDYDAIYTEIAANVTLVESWEEAAQAPAGSYGVFAFVSTRNPPVYQRARQYFPLPAFRGYGDVKPTPGHIDLRDNFGRRFAVNEFVAHTGDSKELQVSLLIGMTRTRLQVVSLYSWCPISSAIATSTIPETCTPLGPNILA